MRMSTMKSVDRWVGMALCTLLAPVQKIWPRRKKGPVKKVLVVKFWGIGSIIMARYLLRRIRLSAPDAKVELATISTNREIAEIIGEIDDIITLDISRGAAGIFLNVFRFMWQVFRRRYDAVIDLEYLTRFTALVTFATRAPVRAGFFARGFWRGNFHNVRAPFNPYWHVRDNFLNLGRAAGWKSDVPGCIKLEPGDKARKEAREFLENRGVEAPYMVVNPNAGETSLERRWPAERFGELARRVVNELALGVVVIGKANEREVGEEVKKSAGEEVSAVNSAGELSLGGLLALLEGASVMVSNDSGPLHMACHAGTPVVGLYGPETPVLWGPVTHEATGSEVLYRNLDCSPCINVHNMKTVTCLRQGAECLLDIGVDEVFEAAKRLVENREER